MNALEKKFITVKELSRIISMPAYTIRKLIREGKITAYRISKRKYYLDVDEVIKEIKKCIA